MRIACHGCAPRGAQQVELAGHHHPQVAVLDCEDRTLALLDNGPTHHSEANHGQCQASGESATSSIYRDRTQ